MFVSLYSAVQNWFAIRNEHSHSSLPVPIGTAIGIELFSVGIISQRSSVVFVFVTNMQPHTHTTKAIENRAEAKRNQNAADSSFSFLCVVSLVDFFVHSV